MTLHRPSICTHEQKANGEDRPQAVLSVSFPLCLCVSV